MILEMFGVKNRRPSGLKPAFFDSMMARLEAASLPKHFLDQLQGLRLFEHTVVELLAAPVGGGLNKGEYHGMRFPLRG
jgi:hypothetical protein